MADIEVKFNAEVDFPDLRELLKNKGLEEGGIAQQFVDSEIIRYCDPKVPFQTGALKDSALTSTVIGSGIIVWETPYAARMYYNPGYHFNGAPERGAMWFPRAMAEHKDDIIRGVAALVGGTAE